MTILKEAILITGCDENRSRNLFKSLKNMGLGLFAKERSHGEFDVLAFAVAKKVLTAEESEDIFEKREEKERKDEQRYYEIERKYEKIYRSDRSKWSKQIVDQMDDEMFGDL